VYLKGPAEAIARVFVVREVTHIKAPIERCFLLSTNIELMQRAVGLRVLKPGSSRTRGLVVLGDRVVWHGWWYGLPHLYKSVVTEYDSPNFVRGTVVQSSSFKRLEHEISLVEFDGHVLLTGSVRFSVALGASGRWVAQRTLLPRFMELLRHRLDVLRLVAESEHWPRYLQQPR
jgi:hypothetical protein